MKKRNVCTFQQSFVPLQSNKNKTNYGNKNYDYQELQE